MKVTAFIRKTSAKNNTTDLAKIYFRIRDIGGVDIKAASELTINPNHWSAEKQGYKPRVALVSDEKRNKLDKSVAELTHLIAEEYHRGVDGKWLQTLIEEYHHPNINCNGANKEKELHLAYQIQKYIDETSLARDSVEHHQGNIDKITRYERFQREILHSRGFRLCIDTITADDLREFKRWLEEEHTYVEQYPLFYKDIPANRVVNVRAANTITGYFYRIRTVIKWCVKKGLTRNNPFDQYQIPAPMYGDPFYLTLEERDRLYHADLSHEKPSYAVYRDIFVFQCLVGCRVSDLRNLTWANVVDGAIEYIPQKTKGHLAATVRVPLNQKAQEIINRYKDLGERTEVEDAQEEKKSNDEPEEFRPDPSSPLLPRFSMSNYNANIKQILKTVGIDRIVRVLDPKTRMDVAKPLYEVVTTHTARKTFIGNLYKQVKDPDLIASMSGHSEGSRAFARYRKIDDEMKRELVNLLD
ncbi:MAG: tyrosine-type recombinase/integrase [Prevotella sp.]|nr:tyrosine-type recombinase/integrase [Prevotella sp.]